MRRPARLLLVPAFCLIAATVAMFGSSPASAAGRRIFAVDATNNLLTFDQSTPGTISSTLAITGLQAGENVLGIDVRPATGQLYALGSTSVIYTIDPATGAATQVGAAGGFTLSGTKFGFDVNPVPDRIRIVSDTGQNIRVNPNNGALAATDTNLNPGTPSVVGVAYLNNFVGTGTTTLYDIDNVSDQLLIQNPPNNGTLTAVGALGVDTSDDVGFDITPDNIAYASFTVGGVAGLYTVNLATGAATAVGTIGAGGTIRDIAAELPVPPGIAYAIDGSNNLLSFNRATPAIIASTVPVTGLVGGDGLIGIDFRPATGELFGLGSGSRLYSINPTTGAATQVGADGAFTLSGSSFGFDFNPVVDRIRIVSNTGQNIRLNPSTGALAATDTTLNPAGPTIVGAGYINDFPGAAATTLYDINAESSELMIQNPPNSGTLTSVGGLGVGGISENVGFDIAGVDDAFASLDVDDAVGFYSIDLATGAALFIGPIGSGSTTIRDIALPPSMTTADDAYATPKNTQRIVPAAGVRANDTGGTGTEVVTPPTNGTVTLDADGSFVYQPNTGFTGVDTFQYRLTDGAVLSMVATVSITVTNDAPTATDDAFLATGDQVLNLTAPGVLSNDTDPNSDPLTAVLATTVSHGTLVLNADGSFTYTPTTGYVGPDMFTYNASDGDLLSNVATVTITVAQPLPTTTTSTSTTSTIFGATTTTTTAFVSPSGTLPVTGSPIETITLWGLLMTALGVALLAARRAATR
jgi:hypothetical protein